MSMIGIDRVETLMTWVRTHRFGKYAGKVMDTSDPQQRGRLKVEVCDVFGEGVGVWAMPCVPYAGAGIGFKAIPPAGSNVWVEFEKGDVSHPVWTGFFWGTGEMPPEAGSGDNVKVWKTGAITITIDDQAGKIVIQSTGGASLTISSKVESAIGAATLTVETAGITADAGGKLEVTAAGVSINNGSLQVL